MKRLGICAVLVCAVLKGDEGMWPLNNVPKQRIEEKYQVKLSDEWIERVQKSCVRVSTGGSGSFVSSEGLMMTNHHVGAKAIYNLSSEKRDLMDQGYYATAREGELKCPNLYVDQLMVIEDVTRKVESALSEGMTLTEKEAARTAIIATLKDEAKARTGLLPEFVSLYQGARSYLYLYKHYDDVRLVMAPEKNSASFGGDIDNFTFPRYCLDVCFFRVYENDKPVNTKKNYLQWSKAGPKLKEPLFVIGHPGSTQRTYTSAHLQFFKDIELPLYSEFIRTRINLLEKLSKKNEEDSRIAYADLHRFSNSNKVLTAFENGLRDQPIIENKREYEANLVGKGEAWIDLEAVLHEARGYYPQYFVMERLGPRYSRSYNWARHLVRIAAERKKPNQKRLKEYVDSEIPTIELDLFSTEPVYDNLERLFLVDSLKRIKKNFGEKHPVVKVILGRKSIETRVDEILAGTKINDVEFRKQLYNDPSLILKSSDPMIMLVRELDPFARKLRERHDNHLLSGQNEAYQKIMGTIFEQYGDAVYPDATFTLRLSYGEMSGYQDVPPMTTINGLFARAAKHEEKPPYQLAESWKNSQHCLSDVPMNFISTNDIIGGNSGSPIINAKGQIVGIIFDGNQHSLLWNFTFDQERGRAISVHSQGIIEALKKVYNAPALVNELRGK